MKVDEILEAFTIGKFPDVDSDQFQQTYSALIPKSAKVADVRENLELYVFRNENYLLVKDGNIVIGNLRLEPITIAGTTYLNVEGIYIDIPYRKSSALYWLLYAVKEAIDKPVVADGAIFTDGQSLISAVQKHKYLHVKKLNTTTGEMTDLNGPINSSTFCYAFLPANLGFGKKMFEGNLPYVWYPLFEEIV